jgi:hypothetical protein
VGCALALCTGLGHAPAHAQTPAPPRVLAFALEPQAAAKGQPVTAQFTLSHPAREVALTAISIDGSVIGAVPQAVAMNGARTAGVITFTVPAQTGSLSPLVMALSVDGMRGASQRLIMACDHAWFFTPRVERCPFAPVVATPAAIQRFERGAMLWLAHTDSIYVLRDGERRLERYDDAFEEGDAESDPAIVAPAGLRQPVRGFGRIWREHEAIRRDLGWALEPERGYTACYAYAFGGWRSTWAYVSTPDARVLELETYTAPVRWRPLDAIDGQPVRFTGCAP